MELITTYFGDFTDHQILQFESLEKVYKEWNENINVISRKDIDALYLKHVLHSLSIAAIADFKPGTRIVDIGTGGGFPGIPLAIFYPDTEFLLVDSIGKKLKVVQAVVDALSLKNVRVLHSRIENTGEKDFDFAVSRAVAPLKDLWQWAKPLLRKGHENEMANGLFCLKGGDLSQEIYESNTRPSIFEIDKIFNEDFFQDKFVVYVPKK
ncbi:MAG: 16S rRNA (guanine(527)-N(7))-methyltransferase RsmG [Taibaiella sp.]|nr:16S rRNA (guanine(527)-N(7))-methyltransferase RsmG [Taibaiella sp.]